jgi:hypothetical protein
MMAECCCGERLQVALAGLLEKYAVQTGGGWRLSAVAGATGEPLLVAGTAIAGESCTAATVPLLPWRCERRFVELRRLVEGGTVEPVLMTRFSCQTDGRRLPLAAVLYRELDLAEWMLGSPVVSVMASMAGPVANVVVRLANGIVCGIEAGAGLPAGSPLVDRHELIARRGVASDRVVDTQVPQSSVYLYGADGVRQWTDTDTELYGLEPHEIDLVRAAFEVLAHPEQCEALRRQHERLVRLVRSVFESERCCRRLNVEGGQ